MLEEQDKEALGIKNKENDDKSPPQDLSNYNLIRDESSIRESEEMQDMIGNLPINLTDKTDIRKTESPSTHLEKKDDNNLKNRDLNLKNKKNLREPNVNEIIEELEEEKNENSFKSNVNEDNKNKNQKIIMEIKSIVYNENQDSNNNNFSEIEKNEKEDNNIIINEKNKTQNEKQNVNRIKKAKRKKKKKKGSHNKKRKDIIYLLNKKDIQLRGNYEKIREIYGHHIYNQSNNNIFKEYEQFIVDYLSNENNNYLYDEIRSFEIPPLPSLDGGNYEELQNIDNQFDKQSDKNFFYEEYDDFCEESLNNRNADNDNNQSFKENSANIIEINLDNSKFNNLYNSCSLDKGNFEEIEDISNDRFNEKHIFQTNFMLEYENFCEKEKNRMES